MNEKNIITNSAEETEKAGEDFARRGLAEARLKGEVVCLYGELGSGKTTFAKGFAKGLGISERIISPTFTIIREHNFGESQKFYHVDLYRLEKSIQIREIGLSDIFSDNNATVLVEWAERLEDSLPKERWEIKFEQISEHDRKIKLNKITNDELLITNQ